MRNTCILLGTLTIITAGHLSAEERKPDYDALPDTITTEDTRVDLDVIQDLNLRKADWMLNRLKESGKPIPSSLRERVIELRRQKRFDKNPEQTRPLDECIKDKNVIDDEVNDCMNGLIEPTWKSGKL